MSALSNNTSLPTDISLKARHEDLSDGELRERYNTILFAQPGTGVPAVPIDPQERMRGLRRLVILYGLPLETAEERLSATRAGGQCSLRGWVWKLLLGVEKIGAALYEELLNKGPSWCDEKIRNDTFRTFTKDKEFAIRVPEDKLARVLNAFVHLTAQEKLSSSDASGPNTRRRADKSEDTHPNHHGYVQGMNVLSAPLLYVMPEIDAFFSFQHLITRHCPRYVDQHLEGVHAGCHLVDECLEKVDAELYQHLYKKGLSATIYAFPLIMSMFACVPPLSEALKVWDVLLAFGVHFNVLLCVSHCILLRDVLLKQTNPMAMLQLRALPPLDAQRLVSGALKILQDLPDELYYRIARHAVFDMNIEMKPEGPGKKMPPLTGAISPADARKVKHLVGDEISHKASPRNARLHTHSPRLRSGSKDGSPALAASLSSRSGPAKASPYRATTPKGAAGKEAAAAESPRSQMVKVSAQHERKPSPRQPYRNPIPWYP